MSRGRIAGPHTEIGAQDREESTTNFPAEEPMPAARRAEYPLREPEPFAENQATHVDELHLVPIPIEAEEKRDSTN